MNKKEIREVVVEKKNNLSKEEVALYSKMIADRLVTSDYWNKAQVVYLYMSYNQEVITYGLIEAGFMSGKTVAIPKVYDKTNMEFCIINSFDDIASGYCNIPEPISNNICTEKNVLMIMPGLAFDQDKNRIGYGGGFYDNYLSKHQDANILKVALCFDFQLFESIEVEEHDYKVDVIITPSKVIK